MALRVAAWRQECSLPALRRWCWHAPVLPQVLQGAVAARCERLPAYCGATEAVQLRAASPNAVYELECVGCLVVTAL